MRNVTELAKKALLRPVGSHSDKEYVKEMEKELLERANNLGIGPQGLGGNTTVLGINIEPLQLILPVFL